jgi:hypothetical protein
MLHTIARTHTRTHTHTTYIKGIYMDTFSGVILCMFVCAYGYACASICVGRCVFVCPCLCLFVFVCARGTARVYCVWTWRSLALIVSVSWRHDRGGRERADGGPWFVLLSLAWSTADRRTCPSTPRSRRTARHSTTSRPPLLPSNFFVHL